MNNNNNRGNNNNRRRGRGNNNSRPQGGGGQQLNRIDSRARGNAPQMLEKYRKLAQDAHLNGDRVNAEYYLQFADHYFRVIADQRTRQEDPRARAGNERWQEQDGEEDGNEFGMEADFPGYDRAPAPRRDEPPREQQSREQQQPRDQGREQAREPREPREQREPRVQREPREQREPRRFEREPVAEDSVPAVENQSEGGNEGEPVRVGNENPFVRDNRGSRGLRPRTDRRPRDENGALQDGSSNRPERNDRAQNDRAAQDDHGLDPAILPPAIGARSEEPAQPEAVADADVVAPKRRGRPRKNPLPAADVADAEVIGG
ncbi:DUF4167 domain-containing protein [Novosphingobium lentum]|uniref:DUF4167 domain-containing protein n=1 Tax=Novosphingobium lentum TaxID=145287 RepID=UPI000A00F635|nr:DUF4167 domain-containing protein [Novosphingobium lentum]